MDICLHKPNARKLCQLRVLVSFVSFSLFSLRLIKDVDSALLIESNQTKNKRRKKEKSRQQQMSFSSRKQSKTTILLKIRLDDWDFAISTDRLSQLSANFFFIQFKKKQNKHTRAMLCYSIILISTFSFRVFNRRRLHNTCLINSFQSTKTQIC